MGYGIEFLLAMILLINGARSDLLDMLPTGAYWQAKKVTVSLEQLEQDAGPDQKSGVIEPLIADLGSPEFKVRNKAKASLEAMGPAILPQLQSALVSKTPEVKAVAVEIAHEFEAKTKERSVRRLMAIRTLGERREKEALPLLKSLSTSGEMFVPEYAERAIAAIEARAWTAPDRSAAIQRDLQLLPRHSGIVGQSVGLSSKSLSLDALIAEVELPPGVAGQPGLHPPTKAGVLAEATNGFLQVVERIGNVRIDGLTFDLSDDAGENSGWEIVILRGQFDAAALLAASRTLARPADGNVKYSSEAGIPVVQTDVDTSIMFPSNQQCIVVMSDDDKDRIGRMIALTFALKSGHGTIATDAGINALMKAVDTAAPLWLTGSLNAEEKKNKVFEGVGTFSVVGVRGKEGLDVTLRATGSDAETLKASADELGAAIQWTQQFVPKTKSFVPLATFLSSLHTVSDAKSATLTGQIKSDLPAALLLNILPLLDFKIPDNNVNAPIAPAIPVPIPAQ